MFTNLGSIFLNPPRLAESADTRAEIKRHDPDQQKRRDKGDKKDEDIFFDTDDTATISVPALAVFLDNFLNAQQTGAETLNTAPPSETPAPLSKAAQAAGAYARADHIAHPPVATPPAAGGPQLSAEDAHTMRIVREGVQILMARGVEILKIEKGESFLASLAASVNRALNP